MLDKKFLTAIVVIMLVVFVGCNSPLGDDAASRTAIDRIDGSQPSVPSDPEEPSEPAEPVELPADSVNDVLRAQGEFSFETFVSVDLELSVSVMKPDGKMVEDLGEQLVVVTVEDTDGDRVFRGELDDQGRLVAGFGVATAEASVLITLEGPGLERRQVRIEEPASYELISREMFMELDSGVQVSASSLQDWDGDGVPDIYDAQWDNPDVAFSYNVPAEGVFTVAFEDNYPNLGDGDFNDFVVHYSLTVNTVDNNTLSYIEGSATARARAAGYDHEFGIMLRIPGFQGEVTSYYATESGTVSVQAAEAVEEVVRIRVFPNTKQAFDRPTDTVTADNGYPDQTESVGYESTFFVFPTGPSVPLEDLPRAPFNPYLLVHPTGYDVHIIGEEPLPAPSLDEDRNQVPADEDFRDGNNYPWTLIVPADFAHPIEGLSVPSGTPIISSAYERFDNWVSTLGEEDRDWYVDYDESAVVILP